MKDAIINLLEYMRDELEDYENQDEPNHIAANLIELARHLYVVYGDGLSGNKLSAEEKCLCLEYISAEKTP